MRDQAQHGSCFPRSPKARDPGHPSSCRNSRPDDTRAARREKVKTIRAEAESKFRALLNENQIDEYEEILRERRERALQRKQETALAPH